MDAFELLKQDHKKVSQLFSEIESASGQNKKQLFGTLKAELDLHAHIEETILYPALENTNEAREITLEAYEEHNVVKDLLGELAKSGVPNDEWDAKITVLKENVEHHVEEEEGELFDKAREALGDERIEKLGVELEAEKARQSGGSQKSRATAKTTKTSTRNSAKTEGPGVLQRLANLIGLGESSNASDGAAPKTATKSRKAGASKSTSKSASKTKPASKGADKSATHGAKSAKPATKTAARTSAVKTRSSRKATSSKRKPASSGSRTSATKTASRAASNQKVRARKSAAKPKRASRSSTKTKRKSR